MLYSVVAFALVSSASAYAPGLRVSAPVSRVRSAVMFDQEAYIKESKEMRLKHLEEQAMFALKISCENFDGAVFPNAMIAGDCVITHLLHRMGYLKDGRCKVGPRRCSTQHATRWPAASAS